VKNIARALELYLENARSYDKMMAKEREMFESGKRHLANMMGWDISQPIRQVSVKGLSLWYLGSSTLLGGHRQSDSISAA